MLNGPHGYTMKAAFVRLIHQIIVLFDYLRETTQVPPEPCVQE